MVLSFSHDREVDAVYINLNDAPYAYGKDLDNERRIDYAADGTTRGVELLCVSEGVLIDGLPHAREITEALEKTGIKVYTAV